MGVALALPLAAQAVPYSPFVSSEVGVIPSAVALSPDGTTAYVANSGSGTVSEVNANTGSLLRTFSVGAYPRALAVTGDGAELFVINYLGNSVTEIRLTDGSSNTFLVGHWPTSIAMSTYDNLAYVTNSDSDTISVIELSSNPAQSWSSVIDTVSVDGGPSSIAIAPNGDSAIVTLTQSDEIVTLDLTDPDMPIVMSAPVGTDPHSVVITANGQMAFVSHATDNTVSAVWLRETITDTTDPDYPGTRMRVDDVFAVGSTPVSLALSPDSLHLYVANFNSSSISIFNTSEWEMESALTAGSYPWGLAASPDGSKIYVGSSPNMSAPGLLTAYNIARPMAMTIRVTDVSNGDYLLPIQGLIGTVAWGDGRFSSYTNNESNVPHAYAETGTYLVTITGTATGYGVELFGKKGRVQAVTTWGDFGSQPHFTSLDYAFKLEPELTALPADFPAYVVSASYMFTGADLFNQDISTWDVSQLVNMEGMFSAAMNFNADIGNWDISSATNVNSMFKEAYAFNQDLSDWHTNQLFYFDSMFEDAESFDQDLSAWSIQSLTSAANFLDGTAMSTLNYSKLLRAWSQQTVNPGVQLDAHNTMYYSTVEWYRESLISDGWTIEDDGPTSIPAATLVASPTASNINAGQQTLESVLSGGVASRPGTFTFVNPTEVLASGAQTVNVRFTPADPMFYAPFTTTVNINVIAPATPAYSQTVVTNTATTALINAPTQENSPEPAALNHTSRKSSHVASDSLNASSEPQTGASSPTQLLWLFGGAGFTLLVAAGVFIRVRTRAKVF